MKTETPRQLAGKIATDAIENSATCQITSRVNFDVLVETVTAALNAERERAAKIAEDIMPIGADDCYWCERVRKAAAAIRGKD